MTRAEKINIIREKCVLANPEIVRLQRGCELRQRFGSRLNAVVVHIEKSGKYWISVQDDQIFIAQNTDEVMRDFQILGRKIGIADVFKASRNIHYVAPKYGHHEDEKMCQMSARVMNIFDDWGCYNDDLREVSDECLDFILKILD